MKDNWKQIKIKISEDIKENFASTSLPNNFDIDHFIDLFKNVLLYNSGIKKLDGLGDTILESLYEIYYTKPGGLNQLKSILNNIEPFLKKIYFIISGTNTTNDVSKNLMWFLKELNILKEINTGQFPNLVESNLLSFKGSPDFLEHICRAYISRNEVHNSPQLKPAVVYDILDSALVVYIIAIIQHYNEIVDHVGINLINQSHEENYLNYVVSVLSYNPSIKMLESDFGVKMQTFDDFEIKVRAKAKRRKDEMDEYLKDSASHTTVLFKFLPDIEGVMKESKSILLHGIATSGKSTILKKLGRDFIEKFGSPYVFYLELGEIFKKKNGNKIIDEIKLVFKEKSKSDFSFDKINEKILILLDGLDEVPVKESRDIIIGQIIDLKKNNNVQVIITSRTNDYITNNNIIENDFEKFELLPINVNDVIALGQRILGQGSQFNNFVKLVKKGNLLKAFPKTPLTSILLAILFKEKDIDIKELPKNISELYRKFIDLFLNRWDVNKGISEQFEIQKKEFVLQTIAEHMQKNRFITISEADLEKFIEDLSKRKHIGGPKDAKIHLQNLCDRTCILVKDEFNDSYRFFHLTIQEYLSAQKFDYKDDDLLVKNFYDEWWLNPNIFYAGKKTEYPDVLQRISKLEIYPLDIETKFNYFSHSSQVLLAALNIDNNIRFDMLKSMIKVFDEFSKGLINEAITVSGFIDKESVLDKATAKRKNQTLLDMILSLRDIFMEFFAISDFQEELNNIWKELIYNKNKIEMCDITLYCLSYCLAIKSRNAMYLEEFVITDNMEINSRWYKIVDVDINIKKLENSRKKIMLKIKNIAYKNKDYIQQQFKDRISRHYNSLTGIE